MINYLVYAAVVLLLVWAGRHYYLKWLDTQSGRRTRTGSGDDT